MAPVAVYTDWDELDVTQGARALRDAGWDVRRLGTTNPAAIADAAADATAVCVGYALLDRPLLARLPALRVVATCPWASTRSTSTPPPSAGSGSPTCPRPPPRRSPSTRWRWRSRSSATCRVLDRDVRAGHWRLRLADPPRRAVDAHARPAGARPHRPAHGRAGDRRLRRRRGARPRRRRRNAWPATCERLDRGALAARADVLSLHLPHARGAPPLLDAALLGALPAGAFVVNVSRGGLVDHDALLAALESGRLGGAALDVIDPRAAAGRPRARAPSAGARDPARRVPVARDRGRLPARAGRQRARLAAHRAPADAGARARAGAGG